MSARILIVGASHAGVQLAAALRDGGHDGPITVVGAEPHLPYHRPPLSKAYLDGAATVASLALRPASFYEAKGIELLLGTRIEKIDAFAGVALTEDGAELHFDRLALATGSRVRRLAVPGADLAGVVYLRDLEDAEQLKQRLPGVRRAVVVGGGFIGLEAAAVLAQRGVEVSVVEAGPRLMGRATTPTLSGWFAELHQRRGVSVHLGAGVVALRGESAVDSVVLDDGAVLPADLVVVGIGVEPRVELAEQLGLAVDGGIVVDERARTSDPEIVAVGDATVMPHPLDRTSGVRLESVQNATDQAAVGAATLLGTERLHQAVPWFWSDQFDVKLQMAGAPRGHDQVVLRGSLEGDSFTLLLYRQGQLVGCECVNAAADFVAVRRALAAGVTLDPDLARDPDVRLKTLL
ncbi:3-phenylpropionate/trans-cinnamate dioxygenase ferredoxin reductase subunit [Nocardioides daedukensis]|uniref:3-phenylpropionate/trans-cinnamate dioxygenase ferredoxin reductase subunit n=1 Tax=Nocardioides daedukensis TaxID=634462 RepID=A0A7Y9UT35_9ACTN|nr:3-phenylpropionate/trans-cinnamate dioxygenase ferredoxin reductase subunit [Nocardioides daedukensis]